MLLLFCGEMSSIPNNYWFLGLSGLLYILKDNLRESTFVGYLREVDISTPPYMIPTTPQRVLSYPTPILDEISMLKAHSSVIFISNRQFLQNILLSHRI